MGTYDPFKHEFSQLHEEIITQWIARGAHMTDAVARLLRMIKRQTATIKVNEQPETEILPEEVSEKATS